MNLLDRPIGAERETYPGPGVNPAVTWEPCLILGVEDLLPGRSDDPLFLIVRPDGLLDKCELTYLRTFWRWDEAEKRWLDTSPAPVPVEADEGEDL